MSKTKSSWSEPVGPIPASDSSKTHRSPRSIRKNNNGTGFEPELELEVLSPGKLTGNDRLGAASTSNRFLESEKINFTVNNLKFTKIVFVAGYRYTGQAKRIYVMNIDGSGLTELSNTPFDSSAPAWSPDGQKIAYQYYDGTMELYAMNADGSGKTRLTYVSPSPPYGRASEPNWSPDGQHIVFSRGTTVNPYGKDEIYIMNADGSGHIALTNNPADASNITDRLPDWGP